MRKASEKNAIDPLRIAKPTSMHYISQAPYAPAMNLQDEEEYYFEVEDY